MIKEEELELEKKLDTLRKEHRLLDETLNALSAADAFRQAMLKKKKLFIRDQISIIERTLYPDIIA